MSGFVPGQFNGIGDAQMPGARYPYLNNQPEGEYLLEVMELRGFKTRKKGIYGFAADFLVVEGPDGASPKVSHVSLSSSEYYFKDIKGIINALLNGEFTPQDKDGNPLPPRPLEAEDIDEKMMEELLSEPLGEGFFLAADVMQRTTKDGGGTYSVTYYKPVKDTGFTFDD